jgi:hypothetical protein
MLNRTRKGILPIKINQETFVSPKTDTVTGTILTTETTMLAQTEEVELLQAWQENQDADAKERLILAYQPLIERILAHELDGLRRRKPMDFTRLKIATTHIETECILAVTGAMASHKTSKGPLSAGISNIVRKVLRSALANNNQRKTQTDLTTQE